MSRMSLEAFRGMAQAAPEKQPLVLNLVKVEGGFVLSSDSGALLKTARGSLRVFSTSDTALNYASEQIARPVSRELIVQCRVPLTAGLI